MGTPCGQAADYLPSGTVGQWLPAPCNGGAKAGAATLKPTFRNKGQLGPRAGNPKKNKAQLPFLTKGYNQSNVGIAQKRGAPKTPVREGAGTQGPWRRGTTLPCAESWPCSCEGTWSHRPHWWYATVRRLVARPGRTMVDWSTSLRLSRSKFGVPLRGSGARMLFAECGPFS